MWQKRWTETNQLLTKTVQNTKLPREAAMDLYNQCVMTYQKEHLHLSPWYNRLVGHKLCSMKASELKTKYHQQHHKFSEKNLGAPCKENHWTLYKRLQYSKVIMEMTDTFWMRLQNWSIPECILLKGCVQRLWWVSAVQTIFQNITFLKKMGGRGGGREREYVKTARWMLGQV